MKKFKKKAAGAEQRRADQSRPEGMWLRRRMDGEKQFPSRPNDDGLSSVLLLCRVSNQCRSNRSELMIEMSNVFYSAVKAL